MYYAIIAIVAVIVIGGAVYSYLRSKKIKENGIETDAVVSRIKEIEKEEDGHTTTEYQYFVRYQDQAGQTVEAKLGNPPRFLTEGTPLKIKYLPEKPKYVLMIKQ